MRSYHLKLHFRIHEQGTLTIHNRIGLKHPLTIASSYILVAKEPSSTALKAGLDRESLCNPFLKSISYKQCVWAEHGLCQCQHTQKQAFTIFISNMWTLRAPQNHRNLYRSFLSPVYWLRTSCTSSFSWYCHWSAVGKTDFFQFSGSLKNVSKNVFSKLGLRVSRFMFGL